MRQPLPENYFSVPNFSVYPRASMAPGTAAMLISLEFRGQSQIGSSRMKGNFHLRFLGGLTKQ